MLQTENRISSLSMTDGSIASEEGIFSIAASPSMPSTSSFLMAASTADPLDPSFGAEVLAGMAHLGLDFTSMLSPSKSLIRLFAVIGRIFAISADYLPDHSIHPEELMIQLFLMAVTMKELILEKPATPSTTAAEKEA
jgi:hypothetical protein